MWTDQFKLNRATKKIIARAILAVLTIAVLVTIVILATIYPEFRDAVFLLGGVYAGSGLLVWALYNAF